MNPDPMIEEFAARVMNTQDVRQGPLRDRDTGNHPIPAKVVAAVLHALADHTHNIHMVRDIVDRRALCREDSPWPRATSLGRYFHKLADAIEDHDRALDEASIAVATRRSIHTVRKEQGL